MNRRPILVEVEDNHVRLVLNGQILMHSEEYSTRSNARRAARDIIDAINSREMHLVYWRGQMGSMVRVVEVVRKLWQGAKGPVALPKGQVGPIAQAYKPRRQYFDPALEDMGM